MLSVEELVLILMSQAMEIEEIDHIERTYGDQDGLQGFDERGKAVLWLPLDDDSLDEYEHLYETKQLSASLRKWIK